jgi:iron complex outermembrane receptor protein
MHIHKWKFALAFVLILDTPCHAQIDYSLLAMESIVVTAEQVTEPFTIDTDPKLPRQPIPAQDGADFLKTIPGFSVIRKGGTDGDPVFRGMAASRINILLDGEMLLGGCGNRMDPPTAYVFPESYDRVVVIKGPQSVLYGPGSAAATVRFERDNKRLADNDFKLQSSLTAASFSRRDAMFNMITGTPQFYAELTGTIAESDDYEDGDGAPAHSAYERWSGNLALGWTPDEDSAFELTSVASDGEAAYADRTMDGAMFKRENLGLKFNKKNISRSVQGIEAQLYHNYIDHVMDNYSLREFSPSMMMPNPAASNPDRLTEGGRVVIDLNLQDIKSLKLGLDYQANEHSVRNSMNQTVMPYETMSRVEDAVFRNQGIFSEVVYAINEKDRLVAGLRLDDWHAEDKRRTIRVGMMNMPNPTAGQERDDILKSGFARYEHYLDKNNHYVFGIGHSERFPDYWELIGANKGSESGISAFNTEPEITTQLDAGLVYRENKLGITVSVFYNNIDDFILIQSNVPFGMIMTTITRNIDATTWGGEFGATYAFLENWKVEGTLAYTQGDNDTDNVPLAQQPPLESRVSLNYNDDTWSFGVLYRWVDEQDRFAINQGNVVGQDLDSTDGFSVFSVNGGWFSGEKLRIIAGVDNLFDETYAEHISRGGAMVSGFMQTERINEPGRVIWMKAGLMFD